MKAVDKSATHGIPRQRQLARISCSNCTTSPRAGRKAGEPAFLVGHSLGGFLSLMCAARHPHLAKGVLLLDSPLLGGWKAHALRCDEAHAAGGSISPGPSAASARTAGRRPKPRWSTSVTRRRSRAGSRRCWHDYITHGTHDEDGERVLSFDRDIETAIYNTLPDNMDACCTAIRCNAPWPSSAALQSEEIRQVGMAMTHRSRKAGS